MKIIIPKTYIQPEIRPDLPLFFIGGPVRGGGDWQVEMCCILDDMTQGCISIVPCRWGVTHPLLSHAMMGDGNYFKRQRDFEQFYIDLAVGSTKPRRQRGCLLFWLPFQREPRRPEDGSYGQDTLGEIGEIRGRAMHERGLRFVIGGEEKFPALDVMQRNFTARLGFDFPIHKTMEETAAAAIKIIDR